MCGGEADDEGNMMNVGDTNTDGSRFVDEEDRLLLRSMIFQVKVKKIGKVG